MALPGPFLAGQRLTAGQLNDATQKTMASVDVNVPSPTYLIDGVNTTETTITQFTLGPFTVVSGGLYRAQVRAIVEVTNDDSEFRIIMRKNTPLTGTVIADWNIWRLAWTNFAALTMPWADFPSVATESVTYYFSAVRFSGTGNLRVYGRHTSNTPSGVKIERVGYASEYTVVT